MFISRKFVPHTIRKRTVPGPVITSGDKEIESQIWILRFTLVCLWYPEDGLQFEWHADDNVRIAGSRKESVPWIRSRDVVAATGAVVAATLVQMMCRTRDSTKPNGQRSWPYLTVGLETRHCCLARRAIGFYLTLAPDVAGRKWRRTGSEGAWGETHGEVTTYASMRSARKCRENMIDVCMSTR